MPIAAPEAITRSNKMLFLSVILYLAASLGVLAMGIKYVRAEPSLDYHAEITKNDELSEATLRILGALYKVMGGGFLSLGIVLAMLALFGVSNDLLWAKLAILVGALVAGSFSAFFPREVERATGVRTPWRIAALLTALVGVAFVISVI
ncbi:hypothetical protein [uncultured Ruegeria sp.]|uniref:hypothetical protein n=1 Tax=uncultured Ruegeria sp. TaxID=259304 RepID=UPI002635A892|nr:hypothetical protein [uncultured Ruegeria sp.]